MLSCRCQESCTGNTSNSNQHLVDVLDPFLLVTCRTQLRRNLCDMSDIIWQSAVFRFWGSWTLRHVQEIELRHCAVAPLWSVAETSPPSRIMVFLGQFKSVKSVSSRLHARIHLSPGKRHRRARRPACLEPSIRTRKAMQKIIEQHSNAFQCIAFITKTANASLPGATL